MRHAPFLLEILLFVIPVSISAQTGMESYFCCEGHNPCLHFTSRKAFDDHNCERHGIGCSNFNGKEKTTALTPVGGIVVGGLLGAAIGSFKDEKGKTHVATGAAVGAGTGLVIGVAFGPKKLKDDISYKRKWHFPDMAFSMSGSKVGLIIKL